MPDGDTRIFHHDLCFGCGQANLFGLQLELEPHPGGGVAGRFFVKQDHQGPPGVAHGGVLAAALDEAMALLLNAERIFAVTGRIEVDFLAPAPVGAFVAVRARMLGAEGRKVRLEADAALGERPVARARATFVRRALDK